MNKLVAVLLFIAALVADTVLIGSSFAAEEPELTDPGQTTFRSMVSNTDFEQIDPYSGQLKLTYLDLAFPGNGGLDLKIYRTDSTDSSSDYTLFGGGWDLHFGRIRHAGTSVSIELQDGTTSTAIKEKIELLTYTYLTKDFWKVDLQGTPKLQLPDGTEIIFGYGGTAALENWRYATEIRKNNNKIIIHYASGRRIDYVTDSTGRRIDFHYSTVNNISRLSYLTCRQDPKSTRHLVDYSYYSTNQSILKSVTFPDGDNWQYQYQTFTFLKVISKYRISRITTPYGGTITYNYDAFERGSHLNSYRYQFSVSEKKVSGSHLASGTWTYDYGGKKDQHLDYTIITDSCGRKTTYAFYGYSGGYDEAQSVSDVPGCYKYGLVRSKIITDSHNKVEEAVALFLG